LFVGLLVTGLSVSALLVRPFVGSALESKSARTMNLIGLLVCLIGTLGYFLDHPTLLFAMRLVHGVG